MSAGKVDVLAVLDTAIGIDGKTELREARDAVAELIAAADDLMNGADPGENCDDILAVADERDRVETARYDRLRAALARIGGAP